MAEYVSEEKNCKMIDGINYFDDVNKAKKIIDKIGKSGYKLTLRAIQYGTATTRFVFDYPTQDQNIKDINRLTADVGSTIKADNVRIVAPWYGDMVCVLVQHNVTFDSFSKKALLYWVMRNSGRVSISSLQRGLGIGFNRAGRIMEHLQKIGCVEQLSSRDDISKPINVKMTVQEINILFPGSLGWR